MSDGDINNDNEYTITLMVYIKGSHFSVFLLLTHLIEVIR